MTYNELFEQVKKKKSFLCVGLDSDIKKLPQHLMGAEDPVYEFNKAIVDATADVAIAYKPNIAFYESNGVAGWITLEKTVKYIKSKYPEIFLIADAKRGDIGNILRRRLMPSLKNVVDSPITSCCFFSSSVALSKFA